MSSLEASLIEAMVEEDTDGVRETLSEGFLDGELTELYGSVSRLLGLITEEARRRGMRA
jgi:hypothetical protein